MTFDSVRAVLFDAVGTLIHPFPPVAEAYARVGRACGSRLAPEEIAGRFREAFAHAEIEDRRSGGEHTSEERERRRWQQIVTTVIDDVADQDLLFDGLWNHFARAESWQLFDDARPILGWLTASGIPWGIASNFDARLHGICRETPALAECRHVFVSSELGYRKPAPGFFAAIELRLELRPQQLLLVGDDLENDYLAARAAGWQAVLVDRAGKPRGVPNSIGELSQLRTMLAGAD